MVGVNDVVLTVRKTFPYREAVKRSPLRRRLGGRRVRSQESAAHDLHDQRLCVRRTFDVPADRSPERLARTRIAVDGLKSGTRVRVLFEAREIKAADGFFVDDFRGHDLYRRFGGGPAAGYGDTPVAAHIYEIG